VLSEEDAESCQTKLLPAVLKHRRNIFNRIKNIAVSLCKIDSIYNMASWNLLKPNPTKTVFNETIKIFIKLDALHFCF